MKKSLVAAGIIIALGAAWTGASWYTGKQLAQNIDEYVDNINAQFKSAYPDAAIKAVYRDYQGGIFSSKVTLVIQYDGSDKWQKILAPGEEIVVHDTVYHGPFPLSQLKKFNLTPRMAAIHAELGNTPKTQSLFDITQNKPFFSAESLVDYDGAISSDISLVPIEYQDNDQKFSFSGAHFLWNFSSDFRSQKVSGSASNLTSEKKNAWGAKEQFTIKDFALDVNNHKGKFDIGIGDGKFTARSLIVAVEGGDPLVINNVSIQSSVAEDDKNLSGNTTMGLESLTIGDRNLGSGNLNINFSQFDGRGTKQFATDYQKTMQQYLQHADKSDMQAYQHQVIMTLLQNLPKVLKGNPNISISPLSWKNSKGEALLTLSLDMTDPLENAANAADPASTDEEKIIRQSVKKFDAKLNVPLPMLAEFLLQQSKQSDSAEGKEMARKMAAQQAELIANISQENKATVTQDNAIVGSLQYADGQVDLNGDKISLSEFIAPFIGIADEDDDDAQP
ncbi:YdgA family protein [Brenneria sp. 4F2]|nr:YdgA family protein [Brenneria bubanii]